MATGFGTASAALPLMQRIGHASSIWRLSSGSLAYPPVAGPVQPRSHDGKGECAQRHRTGGELAVAGGVRPEQHLRGTATAQGHGRNANQEGDHTLSRG